jgi:competence ComEA-like helix-hairpin-helix protein
MFRRRHLAASFLFVVIFLTLAFTPALAKKKPPSHPINLNTATADQLEEVPGIGPATAQKILDTRKSYGAFKSVDDLLSIKGIGQKRLDKMRKYLTVETTHAKHHTVPAPSAAATPATSPSKSPPKQPTTPPPAASEDEEP